MVAHVAFVPSEQYLLGRYPHMLLYVVALRALNCSSVVAEVMELRAEVESEVLMSLLALVLEEEAAILNVYPVALLVEAEMVLVDDLLNDPLVEVGAMFIVTLLSLSVRLRVLVAAEAELIPQKLKTNINDNNDNANKTD